MWSTGDLAQNIFSSLRGPTAKAAATLNSNIQIIMMIIIILCCPAHHHHYHWQHVSKFIFGFEISITSQKPNAKKWTWIVKKKLKSGEYSHISCDCAVCDDAVAAFAVGIKVTKYWFSWPVSQWVNNSRKKSLSFHASPLHSS